MWTCIFGLLLRICEYTWGNAPSAWVRNIKDAAAVRSHSAQLIQRNASMAWTDGKELQLKCATSLRGVLDCTFNGGASGKAAPVLVVCTRVFGRKKRLKQKHPRGLCTFSCNTLEKGQQQVHEIYRLRQKNRKLRSVAYQRTKDIAKLRALVSKCKLNLSTNKKRMDKLRSEVVCQSKQIHELQVQILTSRLVEMFALKNDEKNSFHM